MKTMNINGYEIADNSCTGMIIRVFDKYFGAYLSEPFGKENLCVNQIKVMELVESADTIEVITEDIKTYMILNNAQYKVVVDIPEVKE